MPPTAAPVTTTELPPHVDATWARPDATATPKYVAFTFDDGPLLGKTDLLLDAFQEAGWHATFCVLGGALAQQPALARRMIAEGHEVAGHSMTHPDLTTLSPEARDEEIGGCLRLIRDILGVEPRWFRAPYLVHSPTVLDCIRSYRCGHLGLTLDTKDWDHPSPGTVTTICTGDLPHGSVILCHDWNATTIAEMPGILATLSQRGYHGVTVSQLQATLGIPSATAHA